jgi:hypothetical protein
MCVGWQKPQHHLEFLVDLAIAKQPDFQVILRFEF